jgi:hypothetical protein
MAWDCANCGAIDLNTPTCPYCGASRETASRGPQLRPDTPPPGTIPQETVSPIVRFFAGIGYVVVILNGILSLFAGSSGPFVGSEKRFDELEPGCLYVYAIVGLVIVLSLCFVATMLLNRK